jgi:hypothetical protein
MEPTRTAISHGKSTKLPSPKEQKAKSACVEAAAFDAAMIRRLNKGVTDEEAKHQEER